MNRFDPPDSESSPGVEVGDRLDDPVVAIPCYEPSGFQLQLTGRALCTHTLVVGQTGCGKTTSVLRWILKGLIAHGRDDSSRRPGIFVFDLNADATVGLIRQWAAEAGRSDDVRLLTPEIGYLDLFSHVRNLEDIPSITAQFMYGQWCQDINNGYWNDTARILIDAALVICLVVSGRLDTDVVIRFMNNWLIANHPSPDDEALLVQFKAICKEASGRIDRHLFSKLENVQATLEMWAKLDPKTKGILVSCLLNAVGPFTSLVTRKYLDSSRGRCFEPEEVSSGRIMVFSIPCAKNLETASLLGRIIKARLFTALQDRPQNRDQRLCLVLADEYHYLASGGVDRSSDVIALATLRSRAVGLVGATQSLDHLAAVMGVHDFRSLIPNFGSHFFFRSTETSTSAFATAVMGFRKRQEYADEDSGDLTVEVPTSPSLEYVCPPGGLAKLEPYQAYVSLSTGFRSPGMIWLVGNHEQPPSVLDQEALRPTEADTLSELRKEIRTKLAPTAGAAVSPSTNPISRLEGLSPGDQLLYYDLTTWKRLLQQRRFQVTPFVSFAAFRNMLANLGHTPSGLDSLPPCWWVALIQLIGCFNEKYPMKLLGLHQEEGCLLVLLSGTSGPAEVYLGWIERLQKSLYPIRTRMLKRRDEKLAFTENWEDFVLPDYDPTEDDNRK